MLLLISPQLPPRKTASQAWSAMPTIPSALLPQMKRDYQAMHLRDSLDPKRFMKGKTKSTVPEQFAVSTGVPAVSKKDILHVIGS